MVYLFVCPPDVQYDTSLIQSEIICRKLTPVNMSIVFIYSFIIVCTFHFHSFKKTSHPHWPFLRLFLHYVHDFITLCSESIWTIDQVCQVWKHSLYLIVTQPIYERSKLISPLQLTDHGRAWLKFLISNFHPLTFFHAL